VYPAQVIDGRARRVHTVLAGEPQTGHGEAADS